MFSDDLNKLIESAFADGVLTDKERAIIKNRAIKEGVDPDELDLILDAEVHKRSINNTPKTQKAGTIIRCPNCDAVVEAGAVKCNYCGYVFIGREANKSAQTLFNKLDEVDKAYRNNVFASIMSFSGKKVSERANIIQNFPIPNTKEDLLEFIPSLEIKWHNTRTSNSFAADKEKMAYRTKYRECIQKAKMLFSDDPDFKPLFERFEKNKYSLDNLPYMAKFLIGYLILLVVIAIVGVSIWYFTH